MALNNYDVIIAGAGPAACAAAIRLRQLKLSVCLIDDIKPNRLKVGESMPGAIIRLLKRLDIYSLEELLPNGYYSDSTANLSSWGSDNWVYQDALRNPEGGGWHVVRNRFESSLRHRAIENGAVLYNGKAGKLEVLKDKTYLLHFKRKTEGLPDNLSAKWVIDATGRAAHLLKQLKVDRTSFESQMAAIAWLKPDKNDVDKTTRIKSVHNGWWYSSRLPDHSRVVSFQSLPESVSELIKSPSDFVKATNKTELLPFPISDKSLLQNIQARKAEVSKANQWVGSSWLAVGDAALSFDPLSSQGIFFALYSGIRGAETIAETLTKPENKVSLLHGYTQQVENVFLANQNSRKYYYSLEQRFRNHDYWKSRP